MKKISIALVLIYGLFGCGKQQEIKKIDTEEYFVKGIVVIDSCEYIKSESTTGMYGGYAYTHKGNCRFCEIRQWQREWK